MKPGDRFGQWTVLELLAPVARHRHNRARVRCDCGNERIVDRVALARGATTRCLPCGARQGAAKRVTIRVGQRFERVEVLQLLPPKPGTEKPRALVKCDCGNTSVVSRSNLVTGHTTQCQECANRSTAEAKVVHGHARSGNHSVEYTAWRNAKGRCYNPNIWNYAEYGGRGIRMADEWLDDFQAFYDHIGPKPGPDYSLDRIDNDGHYEPGNVRWATREQQRANQRRNRYA